MWVAEGTGKICKYISKLESEHLDNDTYDQDKPETGQFWKCKSERGQFKTTHKYENMET